MRKFDADSYRPTDDSSDTHAGPRRKFKLAGHVVLVVPFQHCFCGCGRQTVREQAIFVRGHDAKVRSKLIRAEITGTPVAFVVQDPEGMWNARKFDPQGAASYLVDIGPHTSGRESEYWNGTIAHAAAKHAARVQARAERKAAKEAEKEADAA